ncbi:MAG: hypothetical protein V8S57_08090 [Oscillospiraceae bacterium]
MGDAVTFSGFSTPEDNGTYIIRDIAGAALVFDPDTFSAAERSEDITVTRRMPLALHACTYANRIWACAQDTVWCTKLGDPLSWYWYEADENGTVATAAWSVDVGTPGDFSGCAATGSGVVFLKPDGLWRLYGTKPDNFQLIASAALGTEKNSGRSLVTAAETLYYLSPAGPARTAGGRPVRIGDALGRTLTAGVAGTDGTRWYLSAHDPQNAWHLFVYDTRSGLWSREDAFHARGFARQRRRALRAGSERRLALRHRQHGAAGEHARDGRFRQRQPGLQAPAARAAAAGGGRGRKRHGGGAVRLRRRVAHARDRGGGREALRHAAGAAAPVRPLSPAADGHGAWRLLSLTRTETAAGPQH